MGRSSKGFSWVSTADLAAHSCSNPAASPKKDGAGRMYRGEKALALRNFYGRENRRGWRVSVIVEILRTIRQASDLLTPKAPVGV